MDQVTSEAPVDPTRPRGDVLAWAALALVVAGVALLRWRVLDVPLERDEGEYAVAGRLILQGHPPYEKAVNMKLPGIYGIYALVLGTLGETVRGIHLGLLVANALSLLLLFLIGRRLVDSWTGIAAAAVLGLFSIGRSVQGLFANAEHFVLPLALAGSWVLLEARERKRLALVFPGGFLLGLAFITKQHGVLFTAWGGLFTLLGFRPHGALPWLRRGSLYSAGALLPYALTCLILWMGGVFDQFWLWTFEYARAYTQQVSWGIVDTIFWRSAKPILEAAPIAWALAGLGLFAPLWFAPARRSAGFYLPFLTFSFLSVCPGLFFRPHYFVLFLPAAALAAGIGARSVAAWPFLREVRLAPILATLTLGLVASGQALARGWTYLVEMSPEQISRFTYGTNPFPESVQIGEFVRRTTDPGDAIAVVGSEPQIYFYSERPAATSFLYTYALVEDQPFNLEMQQEFIRQVEQADPEILIFVRIQTSWLTHPKAPKRIFLWMEEYTRNYDLEALLDVRITGTKLIEGEALTNYQGKPNSAIYIYRKKR